MSAVAGCTGTAETVIRVVWPDGWLSVAVTLDTPPFSEIEAGVSTSSAVGASSLSTIRNVAGATVRPAAAAVTVSVSSLSSTLSSSVVSSKVAVTEVAGEASSAVKSCTTVKSSPAVAVPPDTVIVTSMSSGRAAASSVAVTVTIRAAPAAPSGIETGSTLSVRVVEVASSLVAASGDAHVERPTGP